MESRPLGGAWLLDGVWRQLGIDKIMRGVVDTRRREVDVERVLFALVANRALAPSIKAGRLRVGLPRRAPRPACPTSPTTPATGRWTT